MRSPESVAVAVAFLLCLSTFAARAQTAATEQQPALVTTTYGPVQGVPARLPDVTM
jgi:uncharacterized protein YggE